MKNPRDASSFNEGQARFILIDAALRAGGWNLDDRTQVGFEVPVDGYDAEPHQFLVSWRQSTSQPDEAH